MISRNAVVVRSALSYDLKNLFFFHVVLFFVCPTSSERLQIYVSAKRGMQ